MRVSALPGESFYVRGGGFGTQYQSVKFKFVRESVTSGGRECALPSVKAKGALVDISESLREV